LPDPAGLHGRASREDWRQYGQDRTPFRDLRLKRRLSGIESAHCECKKKYGKYGNNGTDGRLKDLPSVPLFPYFFFFALENQEGRDSEEMSYASLGTSCQRNQTPCRGRRRAQVAQRAARRLGFDRREIRLRRRPLRRLHRAD